MNGIFHVRSTEVLLYQMVLLLFKGQATLTLFVLRQSQDLPSYIQVAMNLSATNLWLQVALLSSPAVHSYGEDHLLSSQVWQMPFRSQ